jgi:hypothetical protein
MAGYMNYTEPSDYLLPLALELFVAGISIISAIFLHNALIYSMKEELCSR